MTTEDLINSISPNSHAAKAKLLLEQAEHSTVPATAALHVAKAQVHATLAVFYKNW